jgi:ketosteroid isomerase-like protein
MKIKWTSLSIFVALIMIIGSCNNNEQKLTKEEMKKIVDARNALLGECFKSGDAERVAKMYCDSAKLSPNGSGFVHGRQNIKAFWAEDFKTSKTLEMNTNVLTIDGDKDIIYETGLASSKIKYNDSIYHVTVKYINVWRKQSDGAYLLDIDFWNKDKK